MSILRKVARRARHYAVKFLDVEPARDFSEPPVDFNGPHADIQSQFAMKEWGWLHSPGDQATILGVLSQFAGRNCVTICELGVGTGRTANRMVEYLRAMKCAEIRYVGVDDTSLMNKPPELLYDCMQFINTGRNGLDPQCYQFDFGFVDACHCAECVFHDAIAMSRCIPVGAQMGFHDTAIRGQYPNSPRSLTDVQHYNRPGEKVRPIGVVEAITASRSKWTGEWCLEIQDNDAYDWGGIRVYRRVS